MVSCGSEGLRVSRMGLGCMSMSDTYGTADKNEALRALAAALEAGVTFWDTADVYGGGRNESLLASLVKGRRDRLVLASKGGITGRDADGLTINGRPEYLYKACEQSLRRLGAEHLDLYYLHRLDPDVPVEESIGAIGELINRGLVRYAGLSEVSAATVRRAHAEYPVTAVQSEYSLFSRDVEKELLPTLKDLGIGLVAYSPLGRGMLSDTVVSEESMAPDDFRRQLPRFQGDNLKQNQKLVDRVRSIAKMRGATASQVALRWLLHRGGDGVVPIPGTKRAEYVWQNAESARLQLSAEDLQTLDESGATVHGERYPEDLASSVGR